MMQKANKHFHSGEWAEAETIYRSILEKDPGQAEAMFMLSQARQKQGDMDESRDLLDQVARLEPFNPNIFHARAVLHVNRGELGEAEKFFHQAIEINPNHASSRNGLAFVELATGRFEAAEHSARLVLAENPEDPLALTYMGTSMLEQGKYPEATTYLQEALKIDPTLPTAQSQLGRVFLAGGNPGFAMQCFENALQQNPEAPDVLEYLGRAQQESGLLEEATKNLRKSAFNGRANPDLYLALARCEVAQGNAVQAEGLLNAALQMEPGREDLVLSYTEMLLAREETDLAFEHLNTLDSESAAKPAVINLKAVAYLKSGELEQARALLTGAIGGDQPPVALVLTYAQMLMDEGREKEADELVRDLMEQDEPPLQARVFNARRLFRSDNPEAIEALQALAEEPELAPSQRVATLHMLGDALHQAGRYGEAVEHYTAMANRNAEILGIDYGLFEEGSELPETAMDPRVTSAWPNRPPIDGRGEPVFVIGWPGSGQERILAALAAHPDIHMIMDQGPSQAERRSHVDRPRGVSGLNALSDAQVQRARRRYWKQLKAIGVPSDAPHVLDAMWLTVESLPTIYRLFPEARIVVITREAGDIAVSWLQSGYMNLDIMSKAYGAQMRLLQQCRDTVPLHYIEVDFDQLEDNPESGLESLQAELGVEPDEVVLREFMATPMPTIANKGDWQHYRDVAPESIPEEPPEPTLH